MSVIQIGDVHFPESKRDYIGDIKDSAASSRLRESASVNKLRQVFLELNCIRRRLGLCGLLICGDLTTYGDIEAYGECVDYLKLNMRLNDPELLPPAHWHVVPGNHDISRKSLQPNASPFPELFGPLEAKWNEQFQEGTLTVRELRKSRMVQDKCGIELLSLNSCIGCGEWRRIPGKLLKNIEENIRNSLSNEASDNCRFEAIAEQLDAPACHPDHITALCSAIKGLDFKVVPIILAHHNLLPQATPRLDIYTEMLNGGMLRSRLCHLDRPIVYCHGHIHNDPVDVVVNPQTSSGRLVIISAPQAIEGFNLLKVYFSKNHFPVGLEIVKYRLKNDGDVRPESPIRITFCQDSRILHQLDEDVRVVVALSKPDFEPLKIIRDRLLKQGRGEPQYESLRGWLIEAEWRGMVELCNRDDDDPKEVRVRKAFL